jgi:hypothetical protein
MTDRRIAIGLYRDGQTAVLWPNFGEHLQASLGTGYDVMELGQMYPDVKAYAPRPPDLGAVVLLSYSQPPEPVTKPLINIRTTDFAMGTTCFCAYVAKPGQQRLPKPATGIVVHPVYDESPETELKLCRELGELVAISAQEYAQTAKSVYLPARGNVVNATPRLLVTRVGMATTSDSISRQAGEIGATLAPMLEKRYGISWSVGIDPTTNLETLDTSDRNVKAIVVLYFAQDNRMTYETVGELVNKRGVVAIVVALGPGVIVNACYWPPIMAYLRRPIDTAKADDGMVAAIAHRLSK